MGMSELIQKIQNYSEQYSRIKNEGSQSKEFEMPGKAYFIENNEILALPRDDGDCRYPYGSDGFNFWAYASGYMHCNEGIFSPFLRAAEGQEPKVAFFARVPGTEEQAETFSLLSVPILDTDRYAERYTVFGKCGVYYITELEGLRFAVRVFADSRRKIIFTLTVENLEEREKEIALSSFFNPFLVHDIVENAENRWFREVRYIKAENGEELGHFVIQANEDLDRTTSISNYGVIKRKLKCGNGSMLLNHEETASRYQYVGGSRGSLHSPAAVNKNTFGGVMHVCAFTEVAAAGDIINLKVGENDSVRLDITFDYIIYCRDEEQLKKAESREINRDEIDASLAAMERAEQDKNDALMLRFGKAEIPELKEKVFNPFIEHLKKQVEFCSLIKGYVQLYYSSLIGIRDVFQALEGLLAWQPEAARKKMLEALDFTAPNGRCPRQYTLPSREGAAPAMDLRPFIDQGVWVISTIVTYLKYTGDFAFLDEVCGYYEIVDEKRKLVRKSPVRDSVLQHMLKIMDYLISNRDAEITKCVRALYGDWNDALDGLGVSLNPEKEYGSGVSVMVSLQVYQNLGEMMELLGKINALQYKDLIAEYNRVRNEIKEGLNKYAVLGGANSEKRIVHGWGDQVSYYVGSFDDPDRKSRHGLTSNAFWVLSGLYDEDREIKDTILNAFEHLDSKYGLKTFEPHFEPDAKGVGRIPKLPAGTAENGAAYIHASLFGIMALFRMGQPEEAWQQLVKSLPFTHENISCSPYIMPNSYGLNSDKNIDGQSMADWQTGSSNVLLKLMIKYVFGICPEYDGIWIQPAAYMPFENFELSIKIKGCTLCVACARGVERSREFFVNGVKRTTVFDEVMNINKIWISNEELKNSEISVNIVDGKAGLI